MVPRPPPPPDVEELDLGLFKLPVLVPPGMSTSGADDVEEVEEEEIDEMMYHLREVRGHLNEAQRITECGMCEAKIQAFGDKFDKLFRELKKSDEIFKEIRAWGRGKKGLDELSKDARRYVEKERGV